MRKTYIISFKWLLITCILLVTLFQLYLSNCKFRVPGFLIARKNLSLDVSLANINGIKMNTDRHKIPKRFGEKTNFGGLKIETDDSHRVDTKPDYIEGVFLSEGKGGDKWLTIYPAKGRLGNQMFQIASMIGIADKFNYRPLITSTTFDIYSVFERPKPETINVDLSKSYKYHEASENTFAECDVTRYSDMSFLAGNADWTLDGYFQSFKHFWHIQDTLRKLFTFKSNILKEARRFIDKNASPNTVKIGVHVRRGDFLSEYHRNLGRVTPEEDYYNRAMDMYSLNYGNVTFYVLSNDLAWCQGHLHDNGHKVVFSPFTQPGYDLAVMSLCDHMIISVGTFGWWGGWLAGGSVVYFSGYPKSGSEISKYFVKEDIYPPFWIGIT